MSETYKKKVIIALGHFDSVHIGHRAVIGKAVEEAKSTGVIPAVFMFSGDLKSFVKKGVFAPVYSTETRVNLISKLGVDEFYIAPVDLEFLSLERNEFLDKLNEKYDILAYVSGTDYRFAKNALGDVEYIKEYAKSKGQSVYTVGDMTVDGDKVSTTLIKELLTGGFIKKANQMLSKNYSVLGTVNNGRKVGTKLGIPTVNLEIDSSFLTLKDGVYSGKTNIDGKSYKAVINYGARPTFNLTEKLIEAHLIGFTGDLYGKQIELEFTDFLRPLMAFRDEKELKSQIEKDIERVKTND